MKKLLISMLMIIGITLSVGTATYAYIVTESGYNFTDRYHKVRENAFHMYYAPLEWDANHCWASTEVAASPDMDGFAYAYIVGINGNTASDLEYDIIGGYIKTSAAFVDVGYAKQTKHRGSRILDDELVNAWDITIDD